LLRLFFSTYILGGILTVLAVYFYPMPDAPRLISNSSALPNGGLEEVFHIRLPGDRLGSPRAASVAAFPVQSFAQEGQNRIIAELFQVRDAEGHVIGLASKMSGTVAAANQGLKNTDWMLFIPSRGAMFMSTESLATDDSRRYPLDRLGLDLSRSARVLYATEDFSDLTGFFIDETEIERVDDAGQAYGVINLRFRMQTAKQ
jgi:hypothetical protein